MYLPDRLTSRARPLSVLATEAVRDSTDGYFHWSFAGQRKLKGRSSPVRTFRARRGARPQSQVGRVSALTKSSSWRVVQHSWASQKRS
jgi:class 3 adenylate cyclase